MTDSRPGIGAADDTAMTATYVGVVLVEAVVILALWLIGRAFS